MKGHTEKRLAHICILVRDLEVAIDRWSRILGAAAPSILEQGVAKKECFAGTDRYVQAFFHAPGLGCDLQLLQPLDPESPLYRRLEKHGEGVHHIAFASNDLPATFQALKDNGVGLQGDQFFFDAADPETRWTWVTPGYANGVLIEVMSEYKETGVKRR